MITVKNKQCQPGYKLRKGYTRKYKNNTARHGFTVRRKNKIYTIKPKTDDIIVPDMCVKNTSRLNPSNRIGTLRKGELIKYGYQYRLSDSLRHGALKRAINQYGPLSVYRKLDAVAKLTVRTAPDASNRFVKDRNWIRNNYELREQ